MLKELEKINKNVFLSCFSEQLTVVWQLVFFSDAVGGGETHAAWD